MASLFHSKNSNKIFVGLFIATIAASLYKVLVTPNVLVLSQQHEEESTIELDIIEENWPYTIPKKSIVVVHRVYEGVVRYREISIFKRPPKGTKYNIKEGYAMKAKERVAELPCYSEYKAAGEQLEKKITTLEARGELAKRSMLDYSADMKYLQQEVALREKKDKNNEKLNECVIDNPFNETAVWHYGKEKSSVDIIPKRLLPDYVFEVIKDGRPTMDWIEGDVVILEHENQEYRGAVVERIDTKNETHIVVEQQNKRMRDYMPNAVRVKGRTAGAEKMQLEEAHELYQMGGIKYAEPVFKTREGKQLLDGRQVESKNWGSAIEFSD